MPSAHPPVRPAPSLGAPAADLGRYRCLYKNHLLTYAPVRLDSGRLQGRVAVTALHGMATCAQRFIDLDAYDCEQEAAEVARAAGMAWVDGAAG